MGEESVHQNMRVAVDTCYDRGAPLVFLILPLNLGA